MKFQSLGNTLSCKPGRLSFTCPIQLCKIRTQIMDSTDRRVATSAQMKKVCVCWQTVAL